METEKTSSCSGEQRKASSCSGEVYVPIQLPTVELIGVWALERVLGGSFHGPLCWVFCFTKAGGIEQPNTIGFCKSGLVMLSPIRGEDDFYLLGTGANKSNRAS